MPESWVSPMSYRLYAQRIAKPLLMEIKWFGYEQCWEVGTKLWKKPCMLEMYNDRNNWYTHWARGIYPSPNKTSSTNKLSLTHQTYLLTACACISSNLPICRTHRCNIQLFDVIMYSHDVCMVSPPQMCMKFNWIFIPSIVAMYNKKVRFLLIYIIIQRM